MSNFARPVLDYWHRIFSGDRFILNNGSLSLAVNSQLSASRRAMILEPTDGPTQAVLTPILVEQSGIDEGGDMTAAALRTRLADVGAVMHDPDFLFYLPDAPLMMETNDPLPTPRRLNEADRRAFEAFRAEASEQDFDDAYVELDHWSVFGCFDGARLVSAASAYPWDKAPIADLGVLTLPDARGQRYGRAVVHALCQFARGRGYEPQYRCQLDNTASVALAHASGLKLFGKWEVARPD
jgi:GNAT superfamily N-acetyltransferase